MQILKGRLVGAPFVFGSDIAAKLAQVNAAQQKGAMLMHRPVCHSFGL